MTPFESAKAVYEKEVCARDFWTDLTLHHMHGFVFTTPDFFVMGRPVVKEADPGMIIDPSVQFARRACDCWHIYLFSGDMKAAWDRLPWELTFISLERRNELRFYKLEEIRRLSGFETPCTQHSQN